MKKSINRILFLIIIICVTILSSGCKKLDIKKELRIDIGSYFKDDYVEIKLDNELIFSDTVSTSAILAVGETLIFDYPIGRYEISVNVNGTEIRDKFRHKKNCFVYIKYIKESSEITIIYPEEYILYE